MSANRFAFFNGEFIPIEQAQVSVMTAALNYGLGVFEGIRAYWNANDAQLYVFHLREHMERLKRSCAIMFMELPYSVDDLCNLTVELLRREGFREDAYIRPLVFKSDHTIAVRLNNMTDAFALYAVPFGQYIPGSAVRACVSSWRRIEDNIMPSRAKVSGGYVNSALAKTEALLNGYDEAIVLGSDGQVSEASAANLYIVRHGALVTPPITSDIRASGGIVPCGGAWSGADVSRLVHAGVCSAIREKSHAGSLDHRRSAHADREARQSVA